MDQLERAVSGDYIKLIIAMSLKTVKKENNIIYRPGFILKILFFLGTSRFVRVCSMQSKKLKAKRCTLKYFFAINNKSFMVKCHFHI